MRKVYLTITSRTMVPVIVTHKAIVTVDEGVSIQSVARQLVERGEHKSATVEDMSIEEVRIEGGMVGVDDQPIDEKPDLNDEVMDYINDHNSKLVSVQVDDSK